MQTSFYEPNYNQEFLFGNNEDYVSVLMNLENLKFSKIYGEHEFRCKLVGLNLPLDKLSNKKWGKKKKNDDITEEKKEVKSEKV